MSPLSVCKSNHCDINATIMRLMQVWGNVCTLDLIEGRIRSNQNVALYGQESFTFFIGEHTIADVNNDTIVSPVDAVFVVNRLGNNGNNGQADVNGDSVIDSQDVDIIISAIGSVLSQP